MGERVDDLGMVHACEQAPPSGGFVEQGFAAGYFQGWADAKAGRPYGHTPAGRVPTDGFYPRSPDPEQEEDDDG